MALQMLILLANIASTVDLFSHSLIICNLVMSYLANVANPILISPFSQMLMYIQVQIHIVDSFLV